MKLYNAEKIRQLNPCESGIINFEIREGKKLLAKGTIENYKDNKNDY